MSKRYPELILDDMLDCIDTIMTFAQGLTPDELLESRLHRDAIIRNLEVLGEAANQLGSEVQALDTAIPWAKIISLRNRLIHEYHGVNWDVVLNVIVQELPTLKEQLSLLYDNIPKQVDFKKESPIDEKL
jgi:uncharacterized protein with HEPN domain